MEPMKAMLAKIDRLIEERGLNPTKVARLASVPPTTLHAVLKGERRATFEVVAAVARALGVSLDFLADDAQERPTDPAAKAEELVLLRQFRRSGLTVEEAIERFYLRPGEGFVGRAQATPAPARGAGGKATR